MILSRITIEALDSGEPVLVLREYDDSLFAPIINDIARERAIYYGGRVTASEAFGQLRRAVLERMDKDIAKAQHERNMIANLSPPKA
jgi:hypothetical protein